MCVYLKWNKAVFQLPRVDWFLPPVSCLVSFDRPHHVCCYINLDITPWIKRWICNYCDSMKVLASPISYQLLLHQMIQTCLEVLCSLCVCISIRAFLISQCKDFSKPNLNAATAYEISLKITFFFGRAWIWFIEKLFQQTHITQSYHPHSNTRRLGTVMILHIYMCDYLCNYINSPSFTNLTVWDVDYLCLPGVSRLWSLCEYLESFLVIKMVTNSTLVNCSSLQSPCSWRNKLSLMFIIKCVVLLIFTIKETALLMLIMK